MKKEELTKRIESFADLKENWDSYGAKPIPENVINKAKELSQHFLGDGWFVYPTSKGGITFEHANDNSLDVNPDGTFTVFVVAKDWNQSIIEALKNAG